MDKKRIFVWIDLEMTGLNPEKDVILEIAIVITDHLCKILYAGTSFVVHQSDEMLDCMDVWCKKTHSESGLIADVKKSDNSISFVEQKLVEIITQYAPNKNGILAGNSVWQDRLFLAKYMPKILNQLHYRILDVTTIKELAIAWYNINPFKKGDSHRALVDVLESIKELDYYKELIFKREKIFFKFI